MAFYSEGRRTSVAESYFDLKNLGLSSEKADTFLNHYCHGPQSQMRSQEAEIPANGSRFIENLKCAPVIWNEVTVE